jgi:long-chain acyl-CoA synthetase
MQLNRIFDIIDYQMGYFPNTLAFGYRKDNWNYYSIQKSKSIIDEVSRSLLACGLRKGDMVGIMKNSGSPEWIFFDLGAQQIGITVVPIHPNFTNTELVYIIQETKISICLVTNRILLNKLKNADTQKSINKYISTEMMEDVLLWEDFLQSSVNISLDNVLEIAKTIESKDLATIIFTSGTSGLPKGVMLSHANLLSNIQSCMLLIPINSKHKSLSFLPLSHVFERMVVYTYIAVGCSVHFAPEVENLPLYLKEVKPHYITMVPRVLEKIFEQIQLKINSSNRIIKFFGKQAVEIGKKYEWKRNYELIYLIKRWLADIFIYRKWRAVFGGNIKGVIVGAAALPIGLGKIFNAAGIKIREGYGLTETSPVITFNRFEPGGNRFGTVGIPVPGVNIRINEPDEDGSGEIMASGPNVMMGYFNNIELTNEVLDKDGWFHTGDIGKIVQNHFLQITDRKKDIFKTSSGKYIAPQRIESLLNQNEFIDYNIIVGFNKPYIVALIVPNFIALKSWCDKNKVHWTSPTYMVHNPKVEKLFLKIISKINRELSNHEKIRKIDIFADIWDVESGELTTTLKLKRKSIEVKYAKVINELYERDDNLIVPKDNEY